MQKWLDSSGQPPNGFPPVDQFDNNFIAYLKDLQSQERDKLKGTESQHASVHKC